MSLLFFIKPSTVNVDCFTTNVMVYNTSKIEPAIKFLPKWFKNLPATYGNHPNIQHGTLKKCSGFLDLYKSGFILPMWCDLAIDIGPIGSDAYRYQYSDYASEINVHPEQQREEFCAEKYYQHVKLISHWHLSTKNDINWMYTDVVWQHIKFPSYKVLNGIINFKFVSATHVNIMFARGETEQQILIPYKTPLVHLIPLTEKKIKIKHQLLDRSEFDKKYVGVNNGVKFNGKLSAHKNLMKCPIKHS